MSVVAYSKTRRAQALRKRNAADAVAAPHQPPSGALINVILQYADLHQEVGGGRVLLRLSARRMKDPVIVEMLGREARRLAEVSVVWDEREDELFRVLDAARGDHLTLVASDVEPEPEEMEEAAFELTEAALAYLAAHAGRR